MSARRKWVACVAAFAVGGLLASIPAFLAGPKPKSARSLPATYAWVDRLPEAAAGVNAFGTNSVRIARASNGEPLLADTLRGEQLCLTLGGSGGGGGGGCMIVDRTKHIQLAARVRGNRATVLWGIVADDVRAVRISYANGSSKRENARQAFGAVGPVKSISALDGNGDEVGIVSGDAYVPMGCGPSSCFITFSASG